MAGAFVASAVVYVTYHEALTAFDGGMRQVTGALGTAGIWATYPQPFLSTFPGGFIDQVVGTALLVGVILGITDTRNSPPPAGLTPVVVGLLVVLIGATFGFNSGYAINPARDFGPRLFTFVAGWGGEVFTRRQRLVVGADRRAVRRRRGRRVGLRLRASAIAFRSPIADREQNVAIELMRSVHGTSRISRNRTSRQRHGRSACCGAGHA